jgi:TonB family protein
MTTLNKTLCVVGLFATSCVVAWGQQSQAPREPESQVDRFADLRYPPLARTARIQGTVVVRVRFDDSGRVTEASSLSGRDVLAGAALDNIKKWTFASNATNTALVVYNFVMLPGACADDANLFILQGNNLATILTCPINLEAGSGAP